MNLLRLFVFSCLALLPGLVRAELSFGVDRTELTTDLVANEKRTLRFNVNNAGSESIPFTVYAEDFGVTDGTPVFGGKSDARSLAAKLTIFPASFELKPGEVREIAITLDPGAGPFSPGSYYAAVFVQSSRLAEVTTGDSRGSQINVARR
ncbi:MAG TPA: hypothetical protein VFJ90_12405, partial [Candidatus Didemnitutus sp.]|nr:hypothetical protein [Candidatus Didemnitutus sp.]